MRIWDIEPRLLCRKHLLGEHRELHAIWSVLTQGKSGYSKHPETLRWQGKLLALYRRHEALVHEMRGRGYAHKSPLDKNLTRGTSAIQDVFIHTLAEQRTILEAKPCECSFLKRSDYSESVPGSSPGS